MRPVHVKKLYLDDGSSMRRGVVATDIALVNIEEIEKSELVSEWMRKELCTPPISEQNTSCSSSPVFENSAKAVCEAEDENFNKVDNQDREKSPLIKCGRKFIIGSEKSNHELLQNLTKSPIIGKKRRRNSVDRKSSFGAWDKLILEVSQSSSSLEKSPILGKSRRKETIKRKRLQDGIGPDRCHMKQLSFKEDGIYSFLRTPAKKKEPVIFQDSATVPVNEIKKEITTNFEDVELSQDIFGEAITPASPIIGSKSLPRRKKNKENGDSFCSRKEVNEYSEKREIKKEEVDSERDSNFQFFNAEGESLENFIRDTEELVACENLNTKSPEKRSRYEQDDKFLIIESEFSIEERKFVTDTQHIDSETSSEIEEDVKKEMTIPSAESDSDKTVSDFIEDPATQDYLEPSQSEKIPSRNAIPSTSRIQISPNSLKISDTISPQDLISPQISVVDISVETSPPRTPESFIPVPDILDSGKKKKFRPKKGSLGARLQKLITGQVSCVRLWRYQMSQESTFEKSSDPCATLLVLDASIQYGKNLYESRVVDDPYNLLNDCFQDAKRSQAGNEEANRNLVVMTNPDFVGSVKFLPGTVFKIYLPWEVFNRNSASGNIVLHALYFNVVSNPRQIKVELDTVESEASRLNNEPKDFEIMKEFDCPCLRNGKIDHSCVNKFTDHGIDVIAEIIRK